MLLLSSSFSSRTLEESFVYEEPERGEDARVLRALKRIERDDSDDFRGERLESKLGLFVDELKLSF